MSITKTEPVVVRTGIVGVIVAVIHCLIVFGYLPVDEAKETELATTLDLIGVFVATYWSRAGVSPAAKDDSGDPQVHTVEMATPLTVEALSARIRAEGGAHRLG